MSDDEIGGEAPCFAHLFEDGDTDEPDRIRPSADPTIVDLGTAAAGSGGAIWSLPHRGDLDANLVRLETGGGIGRHVNDEVDVLIFVQSGGGVLAVDGVEHRLGADHLALIPRGAAREVRAGASGITYLSVHRRRGSLSITPKRPPRDRRTREGWR